MIITTNNPLPTHCEFCHDELTWDGPNLVCSNPNCKHIANELVKAWVTNIAPIDGFGWKTFEKLMNEAGYTFEKVADLYDCANDKSTYFMNVKEGSEKDLWNKTFNKLLEPITISQFLLALKIPGLGKIGAKKVEDAENAKIAFESILTSKYDNTLDFEKDLCGSQNVWAKLLQDTNTAKSLYTDYRDYFIECYNLVKDQIIFDGLEDIKSIEIKGTVVITGSLSIKRDEFIHMLNSWGWQVSNKINKNVSYLITNTPDSGTSKNKEADKYGILKVTEEAFVGRIMKNG